MFRVFALFFIIDFTLNLKLDFTHRSLSHGDAALPPPVTHHCRLSTPPSATIVGRPQKSQSLSPLRYLLSHSANIKS
ncbi:hypothetical protein F8388_001209 [Cannabis sativa]|uniref:Secreted protein n=1 Tax=Cannabis sativa TaxID=3483 RepID=A0A7J6GGM2_CANSA|nr:hypothetical protein F8388_001209 [Cannabis sativa]